MENPADLINAAIDELVKQRYEMPAFSTLDRLVKRIRALVYGRIFRMAAKQITPEVQLVFETLLDAGTPLHRSYFSLLKLVPPSPTLSHLKAWQDRPIWLLQFGSMEPLLLSSGTLPSRLVHWMLANWATTRQPHHLWSIVSLFRA